MNDLIDGLQFIGDNTGLIWDRVLDQLWLTVIAGVISIAIAVPIGVWLGHKHRGSFVAINISNIGRALPSLAIIAMMIAFMSISNTPLIIALVIVGAPIILTNAYVAVDSVDRDIVDAARGMGLTELEILRQVELPLAIPLLFAGMRTAITFIVATVPIGGVVGVGGGLGEILTNQASYRFAGVIGAAIMVAALALAVDGLMGVIQRAVTPRGIKDQAATKAAAIAPPPSQGVI